MSGKVALITGGTSGIGRATAVAFARKGVKVVVTGRREKEGEETVALVRKAGGEGIFLRGDVSREADVKGWVDQAVAKYGRLNFAFNNAGVELLGSVTEMAEADIRRLLDVNVLGVLLSLKHEIPAILKSGGGAVVNTSSIAGLVAMGGVSVYAATKHAVVGITKATALEYAKQGVRVNAVAPAAIETEMLDRFAGSDAAKQSFAAAHPIGRIGTPAEIADPVVWLCSDEAAFITGQTLAIDGGWTAQ
ncbi:3-oxoacyl-[acyl-carrier protein] reductase [Fimbriiglobus ruber]|uniref:3-oxoacyl-[acyl-carrier protein] reductase n=2 Tax=Fimbriiglobus ruber TaxID=1908690 RepID=A0A225DQE3_9BACT|nr:3-oxoacyl-[acyl-carrier protein] reductase [Fimbriiglobus ruber]